MSKETALDITVYETKQKEFVLGNITSYLLERPEFGQIYLGPFENQKTTVLFLLSTRILQLFYIIVIFLFFLEGVSCWRKNLKRCLSSRGFYLFIFIIFFHKRNLYHLQRSWVRIFYFTFAGWRWISNPDAVFLFISWRISDGAWQLIPPIKPTKTVLYCVY